MIDRAKVRALLDDIERLQKHTARLGTDAGLLCATGNLPAVANGIIREFERIADELMLAILDSEVPGGMKDRRPENG